MLNVLVLLVGAVIGFVASRRLRRPESAAQAASVARNVSGTLGRRRGLTPPELQRACFSEMVRHVRVTRSGQTHAPSTYSLHLHPEDLAIVDDSQRWFTEGLVDALRRAAQENGWVLDGDVDIDYQADPARRPGVPSALAVAPEDPHAEPVPPPPAPSRAPGSGSRRALVLVRGDSGERVPLGADPVTIGRSRDCDITIADTRVSRLHARVEPRHGGWVLTDEGSSNGTRLAGQDLPAGRPHPLRAGDVIEVGPVELRVRPGPTPTGEPGTRALDDRDRTRISGQVLPPNHGNGS